MASVRFAPALRSKAAASVAPRIATRSAHDLTVLNQPGTGRAEPKIRSGPPTGGRSAVSGHVATVFGATGFLGRYLVSKLAKEGTQVIVPYRDEDSKRHLKVTGDLGQVVPLEWDARNPDQIHEAVRHSDTVYNLVSSDFPTKNFGYEDVNVKAAGLIAQVAAQSGVDQFIHVSHLNANPNSSSEFYRTKYAGERAVRDAFPDATIVRPAPMFGPEDWLLNAAAQQPWMLKFNGGNTKTLPVHVHDVAQALHVMLNAPVTSVASTFALAGPGLQTYNSILELVAALSMQPVANPPSIPKGLAKAVADIINKAVWWPVISPDEVERRFIDDAGTENFYPADTSTVPSGWVEPAKDLSVLGVDGEPLKGFAELNIVPDHLEDHAIKYVRRYRSSATFDSPVETDKFPTPRPYHVVP